MVDETFTFLPALTAGFSGAVQTSSIAAGRSNTETAFQARREIVWRSQTFVSLYFFPASIV